MSFPPVEPTPPMAPPGASRSYGAPAFGSGPPPGHRPGRRRRAAGARKFRLWWVALIVAVAAVIAAALVVVHNIGSPAASDPSGAPMPTGDLAGWHLTYSTDFSGNHLPAGWDAYSGQPGGDPYGYWAPANVSVSGGELHLRTTANDDPQRPDTYSTGGVAFYGKTQTYGMYLVRMKGDSEPGLKISNIALLWPEGNKSWPPEIDFYEDEGANRGGYTASLHPGPDGDDCCIVRHSTANSGSQWHTYGVIWTPTSITYTIDGRKWATVKPDDVSSPAKWPDSPMTLDLQSQNLGQAQPSHSIETMTVAWVAQYTPGS